MTAIEGTAGGLVYAVLGLVAGSFASAASHRLPRGLPIGADRSRCPSCDHTLQAIDLVPVASWLALRGRCRYCGTAISPRYPIIESLTAAIFVGAWWIAGDDNLAAALLALTGLGLVIIAVADLENRIIPDFVLLALLPVAIAWRWHSGGDWVDGIAGAILGAGLLYGLRAAFKALRGIDALGLGDVKFLAIAGLYIGLIGLAPFLLIAGVIGIVLGLGWRRAGLGAVFPFGPALCLALGLILAEPGWFDGLFGSVP